MVCDNFNGTLECMYLITIKIQYTGTNHQITF